MKAQDKICVAPHQITDYDLDIQEVGHNRAEEYIRKDTLLEWAEKRFEHYLQHRDDAVCYGERNAFQQMIDKLNSL